MFSTHWHNFVEIVFFVVVSLFNIGLKFLFHIKPEQKTNYNYRRGWIMLDYSLQSTSSEGMGVANNLWHHTSSMVDSLCPLLL